MAPGQNTFTIIPNAPGAINGDLDPSQSRPKARPMTTKQAKKAYQKKNNKGPKLSKAEQRRQDLFEQDRIRKEFEKEKNQARARAARDKKKEKEEKERAEKKKKGLPLVDVHPSQDTIAWFVRGDKKKQENREVSLPAVNRDDSDSGTLSAGDDPEPPPKKQKTEPPVQENTESEFTPNAAGANDGSTSVIEGINPEEAVPEVNDSAEEHAMPDRCSIELDDPATEELLHDELFDELANAISGPAEDNEPVRDREPSPLEEQNVPNSPPSLESSDSRSRPPTATQKSPQEQETEDSASLPCVRRPLQILTTDELNTRMNNAHNALASDQTKPAILMQDPIIDSSIPAPQKLRSSIPAPPSFRHPRTPMGPPPLPPKFKTPNRTPARESKAPSFLLKQIRTPPTFGSTTSPNPHPRKCHISPRKEQQPLPTSTQLFMFGHLDDFFPSPSQEVREVFGEPKPSIRRGSNQPQLATTYPTRSPLSRNMLGNSVLAASRLNRPAPALENGKAKDKCIQEKASTDQSRKSPPLPAANIQSSGISETFDISFFSTQDLFLSSQDIKDLEDETPSSSGANHSEPNLQLERALGNHVPSTRIAKSDSDIGSTVSVSSSLTLSRAQKSKLNSRTRPSNDHSQLSHIHNRGTPTEQPENLTTMQRDVASSNFQTEQIYLPDQDSRNSTKPAENPEKERPCSIGRNHQNKAPSTSQVEKDAAPPRPSPKPFFSSSCRQAHSLYVRQRQKTAALEGPSAQRKARKELEKFQRSEKERLERQLLEAAVEDEDLHADEICAPKSRLKSAQTDSTPRPLNPPQDQSLPRTINQLSNSGRENAQAQKNGDPTVDRPRRGRTRSSYEEMLEELGRQERKREEQKAVPASQETDYGDEGLDDVLNEML
ncbi:hypothetical protein F4819DRAFT_453160 [Hypoxylon fuscum]|nr:hypothetical protein F4819DRAFT_453160 [Hypoxylon fuscum]